MNYVTGLEAKSKIDARLVRRYIAAQLSGLGGSQPLLQFRYTARLDQYLAENGRANRKYNGKAHCPIVQQPDIWRL